MARLLLRYSIIALSFLVVPPITYPQQPSLAQQYSDRATEYWRQHDYKAAFEWYTKAPTWATTVLRQPSGIRIWQGCASGLLAGILLVERMAHISVRDL